MAQELRCPECGETEELTGRPGASGIEVVCESCGASWDRDSVARRCATCGGTELVERPRALTQHSRGTQLSITGWTRVPLCVTCDAPMLAHSETGKPIPNQYRPAAVERRDGDDSGSLDTIILPE